MKNETNSLNVALFFALTSAFLWGFTGVLVKILPESEALTIVYYRLFIALLVAAPIIIFLHRKNLAKFNALKNPITWLLGILPIAYYVFTTTAFQLAPVAEAALLLSLSPLFVLLFKAITGVKNQKYEYIGAFVALSGVLFILLPVIFFGSNDSKEHLLGNILSMLAAITTAIYTTVFSSLKTKKITTDTLSISLITFAVGSLFLAMFSEISIMAIFTIEWKYIIIYLLLGIFCTAIPTIAFASASKQLPAIITATTSLLIPVFSGVFAYLFLNEELVSTVILGSFLILSGIGIMINKKASNQNKN